MAYIQNHEEDETPNRWPVCDRCHEPAERLESVGECETTEDWCLPCLKEEAERMREQEAWDDEMRSIRGATDAQLERF